MKNIACWLTALLVTFSSCDSPEKGEEKNIVTDSVARVDTQKGTDSIEYYKYNIQGKWYLRGDPNQTMEIDQTTMTHSGFITTNYKFTSLHDLTESNHEDEANYTVYLRNDSLIMYHKEEDRTLYYKRTPH